MEMPNYLDWEKMGQMNPMANSMAMTQAGLAQNYQQGVQDKQVADLTHQTLANQFDEKNNPTRLAQGLATLDTSNIANRKGMVEANISEATAPDQLRAAQGKLKNTISEQQIKEIANEAWKDVTSLDPAVQAQGYKMLTNLEAFVKMRQEHDNKMAEDVPKRASQEKIAAGHDATQLAIANMRKRDAAGRATIAGPIEQRIAQAKTLIHKGNIYEAGAAEAAAAGDMELAQYYMEKARESYQLDTNNRSASVAAGAVNKPALAPLGIQTNAPPPPVQVMPPRGAPGAGGTTIGPGGNAPPQRKPLSAY